MQTSLAVERLLHSRIVRLSVAVVLLAAALWAFGPHLSSRVASSAFINAPLVRVSSPIAGRLTHDLPRRGEYIAKARRVELVRALAPDQRHLFDLRQQHAVAQRRAELARAQLAEIQKSDGELATRVKAYRTGTVKRINGEIEEAKAENKGCLAEAKLRKEVGSRFEALAKQGTASQIRSAEAWATQEATLTRCGLSEARIKRLAVELDAAKQGIFLRDGANDAPYSQQQRDRLLLRRQEIETELLNDRSKAEELAAAIKEESERLSRTGHFDLTLPAGYVVWTTAASAGSTVIPGQFVIDLADCRNRFVAVELPERAFEMIRAGDHADVRFVGSDAWTAGTVLYERGSAARADERLLAARVPVASKGSITIEVDLPADVWPEDRSGNFCDIGRLAEVRFPRRYGLPSFVTRAWNAIAGSGQSAVTNTASK